LSPWRPRPAYRFTVEDSIYLHPEHTRRGYGRTLLAELLNRAQSAGRRQVIAVIAEAEDGASVGLHRAAGFDDAGRLRAVGYKFDRWIDTILMQRSLDSD
jgi:L-amino acid N-acyltransferase YncA